MFLTWGLVPLQAGIFAVETIHLTSSMPFLSSTEYVPANKQEDVISSRYIHSAHGIIWLNETLPPYMSRDYALAPFVLADKELENVGKNQTWTAKTTLYSLDMGCEIPEVKFGPEIIRWNGSTPVPTGEFDSDYTSTNGCKFPTSWYKVFSNATIGPNSGIQDQVVFNVKEFSSAYIGYYPTDFSDFYLQGPCPKTANHTW